MLLAEDRDAGAQSGGRVKIAFVIHFLCSSRVPETWTVCLSSGVRQRRPSNLKGLFQEGGRIDGCIMHPRFRLQNVKSEFITRSPIGTILVSLTERIKGNQLENHSDQSQVW